MQFLSTSNMAGDTHLGFKCEAGGGQAAASAWILTLTWVHNQSHSSCLSPAASAMPLPFCLVSGMVLAPFQPWGMEQRLALALAWPCSNDNGGSSSSISELPVQQSLLCGQAGARDSLWSVPWAIIGPDEYWMVSRHGGRGWGEGEHTGKA